MVCCISYLLDDNRVFVFLLNVVWKRLGGNGLIGISTARNVRRVLEYKRIMVSSGLAHLTHDGFVDMLYVFFPIWQTQFSLAFAQVGLFKMLFSGTLALFQVPCSYLAKRLGAIRLLMAGTLLTSRVIPN